MSILIGVGLSKTLYLLAGGAICIVIAVVGAITSTRFGSFEPNVGGEEE